MEAGKEGEDGVAVGEFVGFGDGEVEGAEVGDEGVFLVKGGGRGDVELDATAWGHGFEGFFCFAVGEGAGDAAAGDPEVDVFAFDDAEQVGNVWSGVARSGWWTQRVEGMGGAGDAAGDVDGVCGVFEVCGDDAVAGGVEETGES